MIEIHGLEVNTTEKGDRSRLLVTEGNGSVLLTDSYYRGVELTPEEAHYIAAKLTEAAQRVMAESRAAGSVRPADEPSPELIGMLQAGLRINAIRAVRAERGLPLKEAKDLVDGWRERFPIKLATERTETAKTSPPEAPEPPPHSLKPDDGTKPTIIGTGTRWTAAEMAIIRPYRDGKTVPYAELARQLPGRNSSMISAKIHRMRAGYRRRTTKEKNQTTEPETIISQSRALIDAIDAQISDAQTRNGPSRQIEEYPQGDAVQAESDGTVSPGAVAINAPPQTDAKSEDSSVTIPAPQTSGDYNALASPPQASVGAGGGFGRAWRAPTIATTLPDEGPIPWPSTEEMMRRR